MNDHPVRILIVKVHSQANAGDQAIVLGQIQLLKKIVPAARLRHPGTDRGEVPVIFKGSGLI
jgi:hypothetical protein